MLPTKSNINIKIIVLIIIKLIITTKIKGGTDNINHVLMSINVIKHKIINYCEKLI